MCPAMCGAARPVEHAELLPSGILDGESARDLYDPPRRRKAATSVRCVPLGDGGVKGPASTGNPGQVMGITMVSHPYRWVTGLDGP